MDSDRASTLELWAGLPIGREALQPLEPRHFPDKTMPIYYTKNGSFVSGISKMWCVFSFPPLGGIYITVEELHRLREVSLAPSGGRPAKPCGQRARYSSLHWLSPLPWPSTPHVDTCPRSRRPTWDKKYQAGQGGWSVGQPMGPFGLGFGPFGPCVKYTPVVMMILTFGQLYFVIPWNAPI
jgi:hypothetical protein